MESDLRAEGAVVLRSGDFDRWDFEVRGGALGGVRVYHLVEEHGQGRQLSRFHLMPHISRIAMLLIAACVTIAAAASIHGTWPAVVACAAVGLLIAFGLLYECGVAIGAVKVLFARGSRESAASTSVDAQGAPELTNVQIESGGDELNLVSAASRIG
jgi:hypothetical protein